MFFFFDRNTSSLRTSAYINSAMVLGILTCMNSMKMSVIWKLITWKRRRKKKRTDDVERAIKKEFFCLYTHPVIDLHLFVKVNTLTYIFSRKITFWARGCRKKNWILFFMSPKGSEIDMHAHLRCLLFIAPHPWIVERIWLKVLLKNIL